MDGDLVTHHSLQLNPSRRVLQMKEGLQESEDEKVA